MIETWRAIPGFPGYDVSDHGRVRSWRKRWRTGEPRLLRQSIVKDRGNLGGHLRVGLTVNGKLTQRYVHALVLEAFVGPRPDGYHTRHYPDPNPRNNSLANLAWGTRSENQADRNEHGWCKYHPGKSLPGERNPSHKLTEAQAKKALRWLAAGISGAEVGRRLGVGSSMISHIKVGRSWRHLERAET